MACTQTPAPNTFTREITVHITADEIGRFIGPRGSAIKKFVIMKSVNSFTRVIENDIDISCDFQHPKVSLNRVKDGVTASISSHSESLLDIVEENIKLHATSLRTNSSGPSDKICRLVFKTNLDDHLIGKYIGKNGRNCKVLANLLQEDAKTNNIGSASSFRVNITESLRKPWDKFIFIKNNSSSDNVVFIYLTAIYSGNPRILFKAVQNRMINSITSLISEDIAHPKPEQYDPVLSAEHFLIQNTPESIVAELKDDSELLSPVYTPSSPVYTPSSPSTNTGWDSYDPGSEVSSW